MKISQLLLQIRAFNHYVLASGCLFLLAGIFSVLIVDNTNWWNLALVALGLVILVLFLVANLAEVKAVGKKRSTLVQANLALVAVAMLAIVGGLNYVIQRHPITFDWTSNKIYTLSDQTLDILHKLNQDVTVTIFTSAKRGSAEIDKAKELLKSYAKESTKFHFKEVDGDKNPGEVKRLAVTEPNTVVFESGDNRKEVLQRDYITYALQGRQPTPKFQGEGAFTLALMKMADTSHVTVYLTQGHGEKDSNNPQPDGLNVFKDLLEKQNYVVKILNLMTSGKIPDDASVIVVLGPSKPFSAGEVESLRKYLETGGKMALFVDPGTQTGLESIVGDFGVKLGNDFVIDMTRYAQPSPMLLVPQFGPDPSAIVEKLSSDNIYVILPYPRSVQKTTPVLKNVTQQLFLQTSENGWALKNLKAKKLEFHPGVDTKGKIPLAIACELTIPDNSSKKGRLTVFGNSIFLTNQMVQQAGNEDLGLNSISWAAEEENKISIHAKEEDARILNFTNVGANLIFYLTVVIMPLAVLVTGGLVWYRRRSM